MKPLLCMLGLHDWIYSDESVFSSVSNPVRKVAMFSKRTCERCNRVEVKQNEWEGFLRVKE